MTKQVNDLIGKVKLVYFENLQIKDKTVDFEKKRRRTQMELDRTMKEKNLIRINGLLQPKPDFTRKRH